MITLFIERTARFLEEAVKTNLGKSGNREIYTKKTRDPLGQRAFKNVQKNHWKI